MLWVNWGNRPDRLTLARRCSVYNPTGEGVVFNSLPGPAGTAAGAKVLERDSWAAAIVDGLTPAPNDIHIAKYRMSGFWDTELDSILRNLRRHDAAVRRGECGPLRAVYASGRQFPGLRLHSVKRLQCHHFAHLLP